MKRIINALFNALLLPWLWLIASTMPIVASSSSFDMTLIPISLQSSLSKMVKTRLDQASELAKLEQKVEDYNAQMLATTSTSSSSYYTMTRRLLCLPLDERFNPPMGVFSHSHVQTGDKMSVPRVFWTAIEQTRAEVPWLMEVKRLTDDEEKEYQYPSILMEETNNDSSSSTSTSTSTSTTTTTTSQPPRLDLVVGGPLDFRAPMNYCFLPWWMMRAMKLSPLSVVDVRLVSTIPPGSAAQLRPHSADFAKRITNPQAVLETELKHYSSLTKGSVIAFDYNGKRYWFDVVELRSAPRGEKCNVIKVQDCDIATEFLPAREDRRGKRQSSQQESP